MPISVDLLIVRSRLHMLARQWSLATEVLASAKQRAGSVHQLADVLFEMGNLAFRRNDGVYNGPLQQSEAAGELYGLR